MQGTQGIQGEQGVQGLAGSDANMQGTQGIQGEQGIQGIQGEQGIQGIQGEQGVQGIQGSIPTLNFRGEYQSGTTYYLNDIVAYGNFAYAAIQNNFSFIDPTNSSYWAVIIAQTIQGIQGIQGEQGVQGLAGSDASMQGTQGIQGEQGIQGIQGSDASMQGIQGVQGEQGVQGIQGSDAYMQGVQGYEGIQGIQGIQGSAAVINWTGEYNSMTTYYQNDGVSYEGSSYVAIYNAGGFSLVTPTNTSYWQLVAAQGIQGIQGLQGESIQGIQGIQGESGGGGGAIGGGANNVIYRDGSSVITGDNELSYVPAGPGPYATLTVGGASGFGIAISADPTATNNSSIYFQGNNVSGSIDADESIEAINLNGPWVLNNYAIRSKLIGVFTPLDNQPPASNFATLDTRNSIAVLDFDDTTQESAVFVGYIPGNISLTSGIVVSIYWMATTATTGNVRWGAQFEIMNTDLDSDSFDTATEAHSATNGTSGRITITYITCTAIDSLSANQMFRIKIYRDTTDTTNDTMTGDAEIVAIVLTQVAT